MHVIIVSSVWYHLRGYTYPTKRSFELAFKNDGLS